MNCQEVQMQLSGYLEKSLDAIRMKGVESHLASCPSCRIEARALSDCIALVGALPLVEPPAGFARRVMAHARQIDVESPLWHRLFAVLRTTAPIQATAVVLIGILAVLVYQREPRLQDASVTVLTPLPAAAPAESDTNAGAPAARSTRDTNIDRTVGSAQQSRAKAEPTPAATPAQRVSERPAAAPKTPVPAGPDIPSEFPIAAPRRAPIQAQEISTGRESVRPRSDVFGFGASVGALNRQPYGATPFAVGRALSPLSEPSADFEFIVRRRGLERREAADIAEGEAPRRRPETGAVIASAAAQRAVPAPGAPSSSIVEIRWFSVAPHHLEEFRKELAAEAHIDSEKGPATDERDSAAKSARDLLVKVVILPSDR